MDKPFSVIEITKAVNEDGETDVGFEWVGDSDKVKVTRDLLANSDWTIKEIDLFVRFGDIKLKMVGFDDVGLIMKRVQRYK